MSLISPALPLASLVGIEVPVDLLGLLVAVSGMAAYGAIAMARAPAPGTAVSKETVKSPVDSGTRALGTQRNPFLVFVLKVCTFSVYHFIWHYSVLNEMSRYRGKGTSGGAYLGAMALSCLVCLPVVPALIFVFHTPALIGAMYREAGLQPPVSGLTGLWSMIPLVGGLVWLLKVQGALNQFWSTEHKRLAAEA